jgi:energy-coupling factor transporter ATP-binding protein EcfA2
MQSWAGDRGVPEPMIEVRDLRYKYIAAGPRWVLEGLNLRIEPGEYLLVCGASGSGKSTLCRAFNGLIPHFYGGVMEGHVWVAGLDARAHPVSELFAHVGMVFQNPEAQLFNSTVERELAFGLESLGLPRSEIDRRLVESAEIVGLVPLLERNPHQLSGGEKQLVAIAAALALRPEVIVLDEPYASLDPVNVGRVRAALREINRRGTAIVLTEHRLQNAIADADRMVVLQQGRIALDGPPRAVLREEVTELGLTPPPVVRVARELGLLKVPLSVEELSAVADELVLPSDLLPARPVDRASSSKLVLQAEGITFSFDGTPVLQDVSLELREGECLAIVGANGSGKTTLIKHFNGLYRPARGRVLVLDQDTRRAKVSQLARHVGLAFQNANNQLFQFQVRDEIGVGARALGCYDEAWLRELIDLFRLEPLLERSPYRLSEGAKKRVTFAAALAARPEILVLDEPTTGQDWLFRQALGELLAELRKRGQTMVLVTHDLEFAEQHACRWVLLAKGQVLADGHPWEVMGDGATMRRASLEPTQTFQLACLTRKTTTFSVAMEETQG